MPSNDSSSETLLMLSEEKAVRTIAYSSLSYSLRQELYKFNGTTAGSWMFPSSGYDVWFMLNVWEITRNSDVAICT